MPRLLRKETEGSADFAQHMTCNACTSLGKIELSDIEEVLLSFKGNAVAPRH